MEEALISDPQEEVRLSLLYSAYKIWCRENGQYAESSKLFRRALETKGVAIVKKRPKSGGENTTMVVGVDLLLDYALSA